MQSARTLWRPWLAMVVLAMAAVLSPAARGEDGAAVTGVRLVDHGDRSRLVLETTLAPDFRLRALDQPYRLVIDFPGLAWRAAAEPAGGTGLFQALYHGMVEPETLRIVLALAQPARVRDVFYLPAVGARPFRFVLDLEPTDDAGFAAAIRNPIGRRALAGVPDLVVTRALAPPVPPAAQPEAEALPMVAIDAGHGGIDPGASSRNGVLEKDLTLVTARRLRAALMATGRYRAALTRDTDEFLGLRERVRRARAAGASLFISLHTDSNPVRGLRGASVYTLSHQASDREAESLAARENRADSLAAFELESGDDAMADILVDLARRQTQSEGIAFADMLVQQLGAATALLNRSHRQAGFMVLRAPDIPSVLIELGHLSNREDERLLVTAEHQERLAQAIVRAVDDYFTWRRTSHGH